MTRARFYRWRGGGVPSQNRQADADIPRLVITQEPTPPFNRKGWNWAGGATFGRTIKHSVASELWGESWSHRKGIDCEMLNFQNYLRDEYKRLMNDVNENTKPYNLFFIFPNVKKKHRKSRDIEQTFAQCKTYTFWSLPNKIF